MAARVTYPFPRMPQTHVVALRKVGGESTCFIESFERSFQLLPQSPQTSFGVPSVRLQPNVRAIQGERERERTTQVPKLSLPLSSYSPPCLSHFRCCPVSVSFIFLSLCVWLCRVCVCAFLGCYVCVSPLSLSASQSSSCVDVLLPLLCSTLFRFSFFHHFKLRCPVLAPFCRNMCLEMVLLFAAPISPFHLSCVAFRTCCAIKLCSATQLSDVIHNTGLSQRSEPGNVSRSIQVFDILDVVLNSCMVESVASRETCVSSFNHPEQFQLRQLVCAEPCRFDFKICSAFSRSTKRSSQLSVHQISMKIRRATGLSLRLSSASCSWMTLAISNTFPGSPCEKFQAQTLFDCQSIQCLPHFLQFSALGCSQDVRSYPPLLGPCTTPKLS